MKVSPGDICESCVVARLAFSLILLAAGTAVHADELLMKDGSRLLGKVVKQEDGTLEFETAFAGVIKVQWAEVSELHADEPVTVMLGNEETVSATTIKNTEAATLLETDGDEPESSIDPGELAFINPEPWRLGKGFKWTGRVNLDLKTQRGNTDKDEFDADAETELRRKQDRVQQVRLFPQQEVVLRRRTDVRARQVRRPQSAHQRWPAYRLPVLRECGNEPQP